MPKNIFTTKLIKRVKLYLVSNSCIEFITKNNAMKRIKGMKTAKKNSACTVFQGRIVVSGGIDLDSNITNTVKEYDHIVDKWSYMPNMNEVRHYHNLFTIRNKLFAVGSTVNCEVFDRVSNAFTLIKHPT